MKVTLTRLASLLLCALFSASALAEHEETPLVPDLSQMPRPEAHSPVCRLKEQQESNLVFEESERAVTKMLLGLTVLSKKYQTIRETEALQDYGVTEGSSASFVKALIKFHDGYAASSPNSNSGSLPPAALVVAGLNLYTNSGAKAPLRTALDKKMGLTAMLSGSLSSLAFQSGRGSLVNTLAYGGGELSVNQEKQLQKQLEEGLAEPIKLLSDTLNWNAAHRAQFARALKKKVIETFKFSYHPVRENTRSYLLGNLTNIDFNALLLAENLISQEELNALKTIEALSAQAEKIKAELTPKQLKEMLSQKSGPEANIYALGRLHRLLVAVQKELPAEGAEGAKAEIAALIERSSATIETLKKLCEVGLD